MEAAREYLTFAESFDRGAQAPPEVVEEILRTRRFRYLGLNTRSRPVVVLDWLWGEFLNVPGADEDMFLEAYVVFLRRTSAALRAELGEASLGCSGGGLVGGSA